MDVGQEVEVHTTFDNSWAPGFEIAEVIDRGCYRVRRKSDGTLLPSVTAEYDLRVPWLPVALVSRRSWACRTDSDSDRTRPTGREAPATRPPGQAGALSRFAKLVRGCLGQAVEPRGMLLACGGFSCTTSSSDYVARRSEFRSEHLALASAAHEGGELVLAGAFADPPDGAALVFRGPDRSVAERFAQADPVRTQRTGHCVAGA